MANVVAIKPFKPPVDLEDQVEELKEAIGQGAEYTTWGLPNSEARILGALMKRELATKQMLWVALYHDRLEADRPESDNDIGVYLSHLRKKLDQYGIPIDLVRGQGWFLTAENKVKVQELLEAVKIGAKAQGKLFKKLAKKDPKRIDQRSFVVRLPKPPKEFVWKLDDDVPMPERTTGAISMYKFEEMKVGQSFFRAGVTKKTLMSNAQGWRMKAGNTEEQKRFGFRANDRVENGERGARLWRTK